jgi:hypothetical protein
MPDPGFLEETIMPDQNCPLCGGPAKFFLVRLGTAKRIECEVCKTFIVDPEAEGLVAKAPKSVRKEIYKAASALSDGFVLVISVTAKTKDATGRTQQKLTWKSEPAGNWQ